MPAINITALLFFSDIDWNFIWNFSIAVAITESFLVFLHNHMSILFIALYVRLFRNACRWIKITMSLSSTVIHSIPKYIKKKYVDDSHKNLMYDSCNTFAVLNLSRNIHVPTDNCQENKTEITNASKIGRIQIVFFSLANLLGTSQQRPSRNRLRQVLVPFNRFDGRYQKTQPKVCLDRFWSDSGHSGRVHAPGNYKAGNRPAYHIWQERNCLP